MHSSGYIDIHRWRKCRPRFLYDMGGVGQSRFTNLISSALSPMCSFFDCASLYHDDERRKKLWRIVGYKVLTAQEGVEGGGAKVRNLRQGIYRRICSGAPIPPRPSYAKSSKMVEAREMPMFELNHELTSNDAKEARRGSIYRRALALRTKGGFPPARRIRPTL